MNRYGIKGTFNLISAVLNWPDRVHPDEIPQVYAGHEIACPMAHHPTSARCPLPFVTQDVLEDRTALERIVGKPVTGLAYPNGSVSQSIRDMLPCTGIRYARVVGNSDSFDMPQDLLRWKATCHHNHRLMELGEAFLALHKTQYLYLMYVWGHSYEFDQDQNWSMMDDFCRMMGGQNDIWYAANGQIADYMEVFHRLRFAADNSFVYNPSMESAWIRVDNDEPMEIPGGQLVML